MPYLRASSKEKSSPSSLAMKGCIILRTARPASRSAPVRLIFRALDPVSTNCNPKCSSISEWTTLSTSGTFCTSSITKHFAWAFPFTISDRLSGRESRACSCSVSPILKLPTFHSTTRHSLTLGLARSIRDPRLRGGYALQLLQIVMVTKRLLRLLSVSLSYSRVA